MRRLLIVLCACCLAGCDTSGRTPFAESPTRDTIVVNHAHCILPADLSATDSTLVHCAELFVSRNGYTDLPPISDTSQWMFEFMDAGMAVRRNTLQRRASAICGST